MLKFDASLHDDYVDYYRAVRRYYMTNPSLAHEISTRWCYRQKLHEVIVKRLIQTSKLPGFSGTLFHGERKGRDPILNANIPPPSWVTEHLGISEVIVEYEEAILAIHMRYLLRMLRLTLTSSWSFSVE
jgi:hypothetical protein